MRRFTLAPVSSDAQELEIEAFDENAVLHAVGQGGFNEAEVYEGGEYRFSVRLEAGVWCVFQRGGTSPASPKGPA